MLDYCWTWFVSCSSNPRGEYGAKASDKISRKQQWGTEVSLQHKILLAKANSCHKPYRTIMIIDGRIFCTSR